VSGVDLACCAIFPRPPPCLFDSCHAVQRARVPRRRNRIPGSRARPLRAVPLGSVAELSCQNHFRPSTGDLRVQNIDLGFVDGSLHRSTVLEDAGHTVQQLLLPVVDMVWMDPKLARQLGEVRRSRLFGQPPGRNKLGR